MSFFVIINCGPLLSILFNICLFNLIIQLGDASLIGPSMEPSDLNIGAYSLGRVSHVSIILFL